MSELLAGVGRANITPPVGIPMAGFAGRGTAQAVHDDLFVTTLALDLAGARALIVTADIIGFTDDLVPPIRAEIAQATGVPEKSILLCASHTHFNAYLADDSGIAKSYRESLKYLIAGSAMAACQNLAPAELRFGKGSSSININRRERVASGDIILGNNPGGPCDKDVLVIRVDNASGVPLAALVNYACHPVSAGGGMRELSADYIWAMRDLFERATGAACLFLQGACGNINTTELRHSFEPAHRLGTILGSDAVKAFEMATPAPIEKLAVICEKIDLPPMTFSSREEGEETVATLQAEYDRMSRDGSDSGALFWTNLRLTRAKAKLDSLITGNSLPPVPAELTALRMGDIAITTCPGEIFNEIGAEVKERSPIPHTCYVAYSNGMIDYVPVPSAYPEGGYEVTHLCKVGPGAAPMLVEKALALLERLAKSSA